MVSSAATPARYRGDGESFYSAQESDVNQIKRSLSITSMPVSTAPPEETRPAPIVRKESSAAERSLRSMSEDDRNIELAPESSGSKFSDQL